MEDKSLNIMLIVIFGMAGTAILTLAWLQPMSGSGRILTTLIGSVGLLVAAFRARLLRSPQVSAEDEAMVKVELKDKS